VKSGVKSGLPAEDQWRLLATHGFHDTFTGTWVKGDDRDAIARLLRADPDTAHQCGLATAMRHYDPQASSRSVWLGAHAPGWTVAVDLSGPSLPTRQLAAAGRCFLQVVWDAVRLVGVRDLVYGDGATVERLSPLEIETVPPGSVIDGYADELVASRPGIVDFFPTSLRGPTGSLKLWLDNWLILTGRVTGRFIDSEWLSETRTLYRISA
jgi:hypothetical protein